MGGEGNRDDGGLLRYAKRGAWTMAELSEEMPAFAAREIAMGVTGNVCKFDISKLISIFTHQSSQIIIFFPFCRWSWGCLSCLNLPPPNLTCHKTVTTSGRVLFVFNGSSFIPITQLCVASAGQSAGVSKITV